MANIERLSYDEAHQVRGIRKPLMIGCSGGGGHIAAIQGIIGYLENRYEDGV